MKKITILALHLGIGGVEQATVNLANLLSEKHDVELVVSYKLPDNPNFILNSNISLKCLMPELTSNKDEFLTDLKSLKLISAFKKGLISIKVLNLKKKTMIEVIKNCNSDVVISTRMSISYLLSKYGKSNQVKIAQEHNDHRFDKKYIKKVIESCTNIDYLMPSSQYLTNEYEEIFQNKKTKCSYIPIPLEYIPTEASALNNNNIIAVGRLSKEKGFLDMIDVFEIIYQQNNNLKLIIVGDGNQKKIINKKIIEKKLNNSISMVGFKSKDELNKLYLNSALYLMTSYEESFGIVLLEAASFGVPSIAFDSARGAKEIIVNEQTGYLISGRDNKAMADKVINYFNDESKRIELRKNAKCKANDYSLETIKSIWFEFIERIGG